MNAVLRVLGVIVVVILAMAWQANATILNIDFNKGSSPTYSGLGVLPSGSGTFWNGVSYPGGNVALGPLGGFYDSYHNIVAFRPATRGDGNGLQFYQNTGNDLLIDYLYVKGPGGLDLTLLQDSHPTLRLQLTCMALIPFMGLNSHCQTTVEQRKPRLARILVPSY